MFDKFVKNETQAKLDAEIQSLLDQLKVTSKDSEEYGTLVERLTALHKLKADGRLKRISPDTMLVVAANIFGILWVARYERENVIKSRTAFGLIPRPTARP